MEKLISMVEYVLEQEKIWHEEETLSVADMCTNITNYAKFLSQKLTLGMFIPVGEDGNVLEEPNVNDFKSEPFCSTGECQAYFDELKEYQEALSKVLFKGFEIITDNFIHNTKHFFIEKDKLKVAWSFNNEWVFYANLKTIEDLVKYNLELTPNAINQ